MSSKTGRRTNGNPDLAVANYSSNMVSAMMNTTVNVGVTPEPTRLPMSFSLAAPRPNPTRTGVVPGLALPDTRSVEVQIFDVAGRRVRTLLRGETLAAGPHSISWEGRTDAGETLKAGIFVVRARAGRDTEVRRIVLVR